MTASRSRARTRGSPRWKRRTMVSLTLAAVLAIAVVWYVRFPAPPENLGARGGRLAPCPSSPNCVSSFEDGEKGVEPFDFEGPPEEAMARLADRVGGMDGASIITREDVYLHVEFRTPLLGFVDDVEFLLDVDSRSIHVRSASRRGYSDFGVNRERVEAIRSTFRVEDGTPAAR